MEKLVRDAIPQRIRDKGETCEVRVLDYSERLDALRRKLVEEAAELRDASGRAEMLGELADVKEVYDALLEFLHILPQEVARKQGQKRAERGCFSKFFALTMPDPD